jgi:hypothetical protein
VSLIGRGEEEDVGGNKQGIGLLTREGGEGLFDLGPVLALTM